MMLRLFLHQDGESSLQGNASHHGIENQTVWIEGSGNVMPDVYSRWRG